MNSKLFKGTLWGRLTVPSASIHRLDQRRLAQLLSSILLFLTLIVLGCGLAVLLFADQGNGLVDRNVFLIAFIVLGSAYGLSRTDRYPLASLAALTGLTFLSTIPAIMASPGAYQAAYLGYLVLPILLGWILLSLKEYLWLVSGIVLLAIGLDIRLNPVHNLASVFSGPVLYLLLVSGIMVFIAYARDLMEKDRQRELEERRESYRLLLETTFEGVVTLEGGVILESNTGFCQMFGFLPDEVLGKPTGYFFPDDPSGLAQPGSVTGAQIIQTRGLCKDGRSIDLELITRDQTFGERRLRLVAVRDITLQKRAAEELARHRRHLEELVKQRTAAYQEMAVTDMATGLYNRNYLEQRLEIEIETALNGHWPFSVVMLDVDYLKRTNDTHGHAAGDQLLKSLSDFLKQQFRAEDVICRYGGDEIVILLPKTGVQAAYERMLRMKEEIATGQFEVYGQALPLNTLSVGIAGLPQNGVNAAGLLRAADFALYEAKKSGRNQIRMAMPSLN